MSEDEEHLTNIQAICNVSKDRAKKLLEASSGCIERAVEIHLQQQQEKQKLRQENNSIVNNISMEGGGERKIKNESNHNTPKAKKPRTESHSSRKNKKPPTVTNQGTLHAFLGIPKPKSTIQPKISSFFAAKQELTSEHDDEEELEAEAEIIHRADKVVSTKETTPTSVSTIISTDSRARNASSTTTTATNTTSTSKKQSLPQQQTVTTIKQESDASAVESKEKKSSSNYPSTPSLTYHKKIKQEPSSSTFSSPSSSLRKIQPIKSPKEEVVDDPRISYAVLAKALTEMTGTAKRNTKLNILKTVIKGVIDAVGGIYDDDKDTTTTNNTREHDAQCLVCALELIAGSITLPGETNTVTPVPLQVSGAAVSTAVQTVTGGISKTRLREAYRRTGDLGDTAAEFFSPGQSVKNFFAPVRKTTNQENNNGKKTATNGASIVRIHDLLQSVATVKQGTGSQKERQTLLVKLLRLSSTKEEIRFLVRTLIGNMRLGATMKSILAALAMAVREVETGKDASTQDFAIKTVQHTYDVCPRLNKIALNLLCFGIEGMKQCQLEVFFPLQPMLANPAHSLEEVEKFTTKTSEDFAPSTAIFEYKYDGVRAQCHFVDDDGSGQTKIFSRHLHDNTLQFPDAAQYLVEARKNKEQSFIIDAEIVAVTNKGENSEEMRFLPFQILSTRRGTKAENENTVQVCVFAFDLMYLNGESLLDKSLWERQKRLRGSFRETCNFKFASSIELQQYDENKITSYLQQAVKDGAEGLMVKLTGKTAYDKAFEKVPSLLPCPYESGTRSQTWLKLKRDYVSGFADTIDVVPIGAWYGNGRKAEKKFLSPVLLAVYDEDDGIFRSISRCMSFTDAMYTATREFYFRGTPYPANVGVGAAGDSDDKSKANGDRSAILEEEDGLNGSNTKAVDNISDIEDGEKEEVDDDGDGDGNEYDGNGGFVGVNCFASRPSAMYDTNEVCSIWFKPTEVWEVSFADLTLSKTHTAAAGLVDDEEGRGVALRFPRFKRRRPDKGVEQATSCTQIAQLFNQQFKQR